MDLKSMKLFFTMKANTCTRSHMIGRASTWDSNQAALEFYWYDNPTRYPIVRSSNSRQESLETGELNLMLTVPYGRSIFKFLNLILQHVSTVYLTS